MLLLAALGLALAVGCHADSSEPGSVTVRLQEVASGLDFPLFLTTPPGDNSRLFVVEKTGRIRLIKNGSLLPAAFLDLSSKVSSGGEQGLLGLAFHPGYAGNGRFVVNYTNTSGDTRVSVFRVSANPDVADAASEQVILSVDQPFANHNGGMVAFGPDGKLYIGMGDGGSGGDPQGNGQNRNTLLAKLLRLELSGTGQVSVPADNPFVGQAGSRPEIWSYGLRNPWRFSFDRESHDLYIADVGQNAHEEIDASTAATEFGRGLNYGWNRMEGASCYNPPSGCNQSGLTLPVLDYDHSQGCSVTGGYVYRGDAIASLRGLYFYGDYCSGWVKSFRLSGGQSAERRDWAELRPGGQITSFGEDARGELYVMISSGKVFRIIAAQP
ncbi:MAG TPA: PQQ-dependent sugar dehydrogenase [Gemmatimonadales bacterium]|nr:PQQ-dependent sugar dehydrogenase [Gemmatimonadales bacterium]